MLKKINLLRFIIIFGLYLLPFFLLKNQFQYEESIHWMTRENLFKAIWLALFILLSLIATYIISKYGYSEQTKTTYLLFFINYILTFIFMPLLFNKNYYLTFCISLFVLINIIFLMIEFATYEKKLIYFLLPYLLWITIALFISLKVYLA